LAFLMQVSDIYSSQNSCCLTLIISYLNSSSPILSKTFAFPFGSSLIDAMMVMADFLVLAYIVCIREALRWDLMPRPTSYHLCRVVSTFFVGIAEVVGSTPTRSTFINLLEYGIVLNSILTIVGQIQQQCQIKLLSFSLHCCLLFLFLQLFLSCCFGERGA
jgi:hypothetical protein